jgi:hypothetical protein
MQGKGRALALGLVLALVAGAVLAAVAARPNRTGTQGLGAFQAKNAAAFERAREVQRGGESEELELAQSYLDRAFPAD